MKVAAPPIKVEKVQEQKEPREHKGERLRIAQIPVSVNQKPELLDLPTLTRKQVVESQAARAARIKRPMSACE